MLSNPVTATTKTPLSSVLSINQICSSVAVNQRAQELKNIFLTRCCNTLIDPSQDESAWVGELKWPKFISLCQLVFFRIISQTLITSDKWERYKRVKLIIKHAKGKSELICLCSFDSIGAFFGDSAVMHAVTFTSGVLHWTCVTVTDIHVPPRKIWVDACSPKQNLLLTPFVCTWIQSLIYGRYKE